MPLRHESPQSLALNNCGRVRRAGETDCTAVKQERQASIVRNAAVVPEHDRVRFAPANRPARSRAGRLANPRDSPQRLFQVFQDMHGDTRVAPKITAPEASRSAPLSAFMRLSCAGAMTRSVCGRGAEPGAADGATRGKVRLSRFTRPL